MPCRALESVESQVWAALVAAAASVFGALFLAFWTRKENRANRQLQKTENDKNRQAQEQLSAAQAHAQRALEELKRSFDERTRSEQAKASAKAELDRYRAPLLDAAYQLGHRLHGVRHREFLTYLSIDDRRHNALRSTLYRFAEYFARVEIRQSNVNRLQLERDAETAQVNEMIEDIGRKMATNWFDRDDNDPTTSRFGLWWEEQRGIGELMIRFHGKAPHCIGFGTFDRRFDKDFASMFAAFAKDLTTGDPAGSDRLTSLHGALAHLVRTLDLEHAYTIGDGHPHDDDEWIKQAPTSYK